MKTNQTFFLGLSFSIFSVLAHSQTSTDVSLEEQLQGLQTTQSELLNAADREKIYSVQDRHNSLSMRHEFGLRGGKNITSDSMLETTQIQLDYRFYFNPKWSLNFSAASVFNSLSDSGQRLYDENGLVPDVSNAKFRTDLLARYNLFYGKFRVSMDSNMYFDHYVGFGPGYMILDRGNSMAVVAETGLTFWTSNQLNFNFGIKDYYYKEIRRLSEGNAHNVVLALGVGWLLGSEN